MFLFSLGTVCTLFYEVKEGEMIKTTPFKWVRMGMSIP